MFENLMKALKSQPTAKIQIRDPKVIREQYSYWRLRIMYSMIIGYAAFYLVRLNFSVAIPEFIKVFHITESEIGFVLSAFSIVYGFGKFINGVIADHANARYFMAIGLVLSGIFNVLLGCSAGFASLCFFWLLNAYAQSMGWPPCARMLTQWYPQNKLGTMCGIWNCSHQIGGAIALSLSGILITYFGWAASFIIPGVLVIAVGFFLVNRLRDTPTSLGLPDVDLLEGCDHGANSRVLTFKETFYEHILPNRMLWCVCFANFFIYIVRMGILTWAPTFLLDEKGINLISAGFSSAAFEIAGIFGSLLAGSLSDVVFKGRRGPVNTIFTVILTAGLILLYWIPNNSFCLSFLILSIIGFLVYGPQMLAGLTAIDVSGKNVAATATGLTGTFGYIGSAICGILIGIIVTSWGWNTGFLFFIISSFIASILFMFTWNATKVQP